MKLKSLAAFALAAVTSVVGAYVSADWVETRSAEVVRSELIDAQHDWAEVSTEGLQVILSGTAPDEAKRFSAVTAVGRVVDPDRIIDQLDVAAREAIEPPKFSVEMLRNASGISLIGLVPTVIGVEDLSSSIGGLADASEITNLVETADYPVPQGWEEAVDFAVDALSRLPRSKISVAPYAVEITAISDSPQEKRRLEAELARRAPDGVRLALNISAPRPVITPFTLRLTLAEDGTARFDACSAESIASKTRILRAASEVGISGKADCAIGLGVPTPRWSEAVETAIGALNELGGGSLTFSDADVTLIALDTASQSKFDRVVGELDADLPEVFSLHAVLPEKVDIDGTEEAQIPEFVATNSPEGIVQLRGRLTNKGVEEIVGSFARAQFGSDNVYLATREDPELPNTWPVRVLAALEALGELDHGSALVQEDFVEIRGTSGSRDASDEVSRILADKLGDSENFDLSIRYDELLDPTLNIPTPEECVARINTILNANKIVFEPSSAEISPAASDTIDLFAEVVDLCDRVQMEIGGHTDSQGRESMNLDLSQSRADSVLAALQARRVLTRNLTAKGYGESQPIADNDTEEGREANRRIEVKLLSDARVAEGQASEDDAEAPEEEDGTGDQSEQN